jgi:hypothetical protein
MKHIFTALALVALGALLSCKKNNPDTYTLQTTWKMVSVIDLATGTAMAKPGTEPKEVFVGFCSIGPPRGSFAGNTPNNTFNGIYHNASAQLLTVESYSGSKVSDSPWGSAFADNFINTQSYSFDNMGNLRLHTPQKILVFQKP